MKIIQNFSSGKHINQLPLFDISLWYLGAKQLKSFGYTIKLYCEKKDFDFLKKWKLFDLYDEIDTDFLETLPQDVDYQKINDNYFWSARKIFCIKHEFEISGEPFMYMDTDILLFKPFIPNKAFDLVVWEVESKSAYFDWDYFSLPENYQLDEVMACTNIAFNCGILKFRTYKIFKKYFDEYLKFTIGNPCEMLKPFLDETMEHNPTTVEYTKRNIWATNAEQRILAGVAIRNNWLVKTFMGNSPVGKIGYSENGIHYYGLRGFLRAINFWLDDGKEYDETMNTFIDEYNEHFKMFLTTFKQNNDTDILEELLKDEDVKELYYNNKKILKYK